MLPAVRPSPHPLRLLWLAALMLCLVLKPVLGLAGELHRDWHDSAHKAAQASAAALLGAEQEATEHGDSSGWHGVLHIDLCCSNVALATDIVVPPAPQLPPPALPYRSRHRAPAPDPDPLRPPIRA